MRQVPKSKATTTMNPKDLLGLRKVNLFTVPSSSIIYEALAMMDGARKYGAYNWRTKKVIASIYLAAALRHIFSWLDGEEQARDSRIPHLGHAKACLGILIDALTTGNLIDDRPPKGSAADLLALFVDFFEEPHGDRARLHRHRRPADGRGRKRSSGTR